MTQLTLGSLFEGIGGFSLAGLYAGMKPVFSSEIEPFPIRVTRKRLPSVRHYGDIHTLDGSKLEPVDVLTFGFPCQDLSVAGKRDGLQGGRSSLFFEAVRIIKEMRQATNAVNKTVFQRLLGIHPGGPGHEVGGLVAGDLNAGAVDVEEAFLAGFQQMDGILHVSGIADGDSAGIMDHPQTAGGHFQMIGGHAQHRRGGGRCAGYRDADLAGVGDHIVVHPHRGVAGAAIGVQPNVNMGFWKEQDVLLYIKTYNIPYAKDIYGEIVEKPNGQLTTTMETRTGCYVCPFGQSCRRAKGTETRYQRLKRLYPKQYEYCMRPLEENGLGMKPVLDFLEIPYE